MFSEQAHSSTQFSEKGTYIRWCCRGTVDRPTSSAYNTVADRSSPVSFVARNFLEAVALVLCVAGLATVLYQLLRQSLVVGYLVAGLELHRACWSLQESRIVSRSIPA